MANWFYYDDNGYKLGPINDVQLKILVSNETIRPHTLVETEDGKQTKAGKIKGLEFPQRETPSGDARSFMDSSSANTSFAPQHFAPLHHKQAPDGQLNRLTYIFLATFFGTIGLHDFYAKHNISGWIHVALCGPLILLGVGGSVLMLFAPEVVNEAVTEAMESMMTRGRPSVGTRFLLALFRIGLLGSMLSEIWGWLEIPTVTEDGNGLPMKE